MVFPSKERIAAGAAAGDTVQVHLELEIGHRNVELHEELNSALVAAGKRDAFESLSYSQRREFARQVDEAKSEETRERRILKVVSAIKG